MNGDSSYRTNFARIFTHRKKVEETLRTSANFQVSVFLTSDQRLQHGCRHRLLLLLLLLGAGLLHVGRSRRHLCPDGPPQPGTVTYVKFIGFCIPCSLYYVHSTPTPHRHARPPRPEGRVRRDTEQGGRRRLQGQQLHARVGRQLLRVHRRVPHGTVQVPDVVSAARQ